jgi:hypothetical protein
MTIRRRAPFVAPLLLLVAACLAACGSTTPSPSPPPGTPVPSTTPATAAPSEAALPRRGAEVFDPAQGVWELAASDDNLGGVAETAVIRKLGDSSEIFAACTGSGSLHVSVTAIKTVDSDPVTLADQIVACPDAEGQHIAVKTIVPAGWNANAEGVPSDPSIRYQVLVGTIVP